MEDIMLNMEELQKELNKAIAELSQATNLDERIKLSQLISNLSQSIGVFFNFASDMMMHDIDLGDDEFDDEI